MNRETIKNVNDYECFLKGMLCCPGSGQELLSALGVTLVCHVSNVFSSSEITDSFQNQ